MIDYVCKICNKKFSAWNKNRKTCSKKCCSIYMSKNMKGKLPKNIELFTERGKRTRFKKGMVQKTKFHLDKGLLSDLYTHQNKSMKDIATDFGVCVASVHNYLIEYNIPCRSQGFQEGNEVQVGEKHYNWKGGISCEPYCDIWLDREYKQSIKDRDGNRCLNPDCRGNCNHLPLHIHHIDHNKKNCGPENLITICNSCNTRANSDLEWHKDWYQAIMYRRYNYKYGGM